MFGNPQLKVAAAPCQNQHLPNPFSHSVLWNRPRQHPVRLDEMATKQASASRFAVDMLDSFLL